MGMIHRVVSIEPMLKGFMTMPEFKESRYLLGNLMARIRMAVLYYHANRDQKIVCGTSNRSEFMLGYCTKFGDNAADLQPLLHLYKTEVFEYAREMGISGVNYQKSTLRLVYGKDRAMKKRSVFPMQKLIFHSRLLSRMTGLQQHSPKKRCSCS